MKTKNIVLVYYALTIVALGNLALATIDSNIPAFCGWLIVIILSIQTILCNTEK